MEKKRLEILAPAGSFESMKAAVHAGADAVYMGGSRFGARAYAENPEQDLLLQAIDYAHLYGVRLYLTVNTLLKERELEQELYEYLLPYYEHGLDAVIVQDLGVLKAVREWFPDLHVHASTQMTLCGAGGVRLLKEAGAQRAVLARELSLGEIQRIHKEVDIEIECFVHGALCYCYSGQCLFSSILGGRSGNRGRCAQPCRLPYEALDGSRIVSKKGENALLSPKDICAVDLIPQIAEAGVYSLKIEGRMKRPEYTAGVVRIYRKYVDHYLQYGAENYRVSDEDRKELLLLFSRDGFSRGYYEQHNGRNMMALKNQQASEQEKRKYEALIAELKKRYVDTAKKIPIWGRLRAEEGKPLELSLRADSGRGTRSGDVLTVYGECPQKAQNRPMEAEQFRKQLGKTGNTPFEWKDLQMEIDGELFVPVQALNGLRRDALERMEEKLTCGFRRNSVQAPAEPGCGQKEMGCGQTEPDCGQMKPASVQTSAEPGRTQTEEGFGNSAASRKTPGRAEAPRLHISVETGEQLFAVLEMAESLKNSREEALTAVYVDAESSEEELSGLLEQIHGEGLQAYVMLPSIFRMETADRYEKKRRFWMELETDGYVLRNLEEYEFLRRAGWMGGQILDHNLYTFNRRSRKLWRDEGIHMQTNPLELNRAELREISAGDCIQVIYGRYPMMTTAGCLHRTLDRCAKKPGQWILKDRYQKEFPVKNYCRDCYNIIYNSQPLYLLDQMDAVRSLGVGACRIMFITEEEGQVRQVLTDWLDRARPQNEFTRGHFKRGVE